MLFVNLIIAVYKWSILLNFRKNAVMEMFLWNDSEFFRTTSFRNTWATGTVSAEPLLSDNSTLLTQCPDSYTVFQIISTRF